MLLCISLTIFKYTKTVYEREQTIFNWQLRRRHLHESCVWSTYIYTRGWLQTCKMTTVKKVVVTMNCRKYKQKHKKVFNRELKTALDILFTVTYIAHKATQFLGRTWVQHDSVWPGQCIIHMRKTGHLLGSYWIKIGLMG